MRFGKPLNWIAASYENNPHKNGRLWERFDILHETEFMIHGVSNVDLDWAEAIGIA